MNMQQRVEAEEAMKDTHQAMMRDLDFIAGRIDILNADRERIAAILKAFYFAPVSLSSVQPILALAVEMNPDLAEQRR